MNTLTRTDLRSLEFHKLIANKLMKEPSLWNKVHTNLTNIRRKLRMTPSYEEWDRIVKNNSKESIIEIICAEDEDSQR